MCVCLKWSSNNVICVDFKIQLISSETAVADNEERSVDN